MKLGRRVIRHINFTLPRRIDGRWIKLPVLGGLKAGISGQRFLLDILKHFLPKLDGAVVDVGVVKGIAQQEIVREGLEKKARSTIHDFGEILVLDGRYGPYIKSGKRNYKIPKGIEPESLDEVACQKIIAEAPPSRSNRGSKNKSAKKKTA